MDKNKALQLWEEKYGSREYVYDYAAQKMVKEEFEDESSSYSWTIDFIKPLTNGGFNQSSNMMICSVLTKKLRQDKSTFRIGNALFEVRKGKKYGTFALYDVTDRNHPFDVSTVTDETLTDEYRTKRQIDLYGREKKETFVLPDLGNIRKNVFDEHAPEILPEEREISVEPVVERQIETKIEDEVVIENVTPIVEEKMESPIVTEVVEEETPEVLNLFEVKEEEPDVSMVLLSDEEEPLVDERNVLFDTMNKEREYADDLRSRYHSSLAKDEKDKQTILTLSSNCNALKESLTALRDKIVSMQNKIDAYKVEKENLELSKSEETKSQNDVIQALNQENASLKSNLGKQYNDYEQLQAQYQEIYAKCSSLEQEKTEWDSAKESNLKKDETLHEKDKENEELNNQISQLNQLVQEKTSLIDSLQAQLAESKESFRVKSDEFDSLNASYNHLVSLKEDNDKSLTEKESEKSALEDEKQKLMSRIDTLLAEKTMEDERFRNVSAENDELREQLKTDKEESDKAMLEKEDEYQKLVAEHEELKKEKENLSASLIAASAEKESNYDKAVQLNVRLNESQATVDKLSGENDELKKELEENDNAHKEAIEVLMKQKAEADGKIIFITCGGDIEHYSDYLFYLSDTDKRNTKETVLEALSLYPSWHRKDEQYVSTLLEGKEEIGANVSLLKESDVSYLASEKENREKAMSYWASKYGDIDQTTDFAGRIINRNHYLDKEDSQGWNYIKIKSDDREYVGNVLIANMRTLLDYKENGGFKSNGQDFKVVEENGVYSVESEAYVTDPYNLVKTLRVTRENLAKKSPIIYIFVKVLGSKTTQPEDSKLLEFYDLIDRTVRRTCSHSFIEMKTVTGKGNYAFLTFDGSIEGAYKEALDYALLLNSYRNELKKDENGINAVIVLDQVEIPYSYRHFSFEQMLALTKDLEMRALNYEFIQTAITNSMIKRAVHLGPSIIDNLPIDQSTLKESSIGQARSFSDIYNFKDKFYLYNYVFTLKKDAEEEE